MINTDLFREARTSRGLLTGTILAGLFSAVATVLQAYLLAAIINEVFFEGLHFNEVQSLFFLLLGVVLFRAVTVLLREAFANQVAASVKADLRLRLFDHLIARGYTYLRQESSAEISSTLITRVEALEAYFAQYIPQVFLAAFIPFTILFVIFPLDVLSGIVLAVTAPLIPFFMILIGRLAENLTQRQYTLLSRLSTHYLDVLQGLTTLKILGRSRDQITTIQRSSQKYADATLKVLRVAFLSALVLELLSTISTALLAVEIGLRLRAGRMEFQESLFILILAPEFYLALRMLGTRFHAGMEGSAAAERIFSFLNAPAPPQPQSFIAGHPFQSQIEFQNVSFTYPEAAEPALREICFSICKGQKIALVGKSGSGKTTLSAVLAGLLHPDAGLILVDGTPLAGLSPDYWRSQLTWVSQFPALFNTSIAENIRAFQPGASDQQVVRAATQAHLHDFIQSLPQGYDTNVGERALKLSGGQAQRLALARAFLKDAPLMILDEPSSNLDPLVEASLVSLIDQEPRDRTILVIAHRLSTIRNADQILVLQNGRLVQQGTHDVLEKESGFYASALQVNQRGSV